MTTEHSITKRLAELRKLDPAAVHQAWEAFFGRLCRVANRRLGAGRAHAASGEDVALSAFASVCRRLDQYPQITTRTDLWRLLVTVTERKAWKLLRAENRLKRGGGKILDESALRRGGASKAPGMAELAAAEPSPSFIASMTETVRSMFEALDPQARRVAQWKLEGDTNEEIANKLQRSVATVERKLKLIRAIWSSGSGPTPNDPS